MFIDSRDNAACSLRNADLPFRIQYARTNTLKYSHFYRTVKAWRYLPMHVRKSDSLSEFKQLCKTYSSQLGEQGWRSGESVRLPPLCPGFNSRTRRHMWVEFVVGSLLCSERYSGFPSLLNSNSSLESGKCP